MGQFICFENVQKVYGTGEVKTIAVQDVSFEIEKGEFCVVVGPSGAGKTTILNILGGMDTPSGGQITIDSVEITKHTQRQLTAYRRYDVGFVFQFYNLVQNLTAKENVELASEICKDPLDPTQTLCKVGLEHRMNSFPAQLSGGEQQRVSIARALAKNPKLLLCDEPTGALDDETGKQVLKLLQETARKSGMTVILITHNTAITQMADRIIKIKNGRMAKMTLQSVPKQADDIEW